MDNTPSSQLDLMQNMVKNLVSQERVNKATSIPDISTLTYKHTVLDDIASRKVKKSEIQYRNQIFSSLTDSLLNIVRDSDNKTTTIIKNLSLSTDFTLDRVTQDVVTKIKGLGLESMQIDGILYVGGED